MIFENDVVTKLLVQYNKEKDETKRDLLMNDILIQTQPLVRSMVLADYRDDRIEADDMIQDILIHIMRKITRYSPDRGSLHNWLSTLIRNKAIDILRKVQRGIPTISYDDELVELDLTATGKADPIIKRWKMLAIWLYSRFQDLTVDESVDISDIILTGLMSDKSRKLLLTDLQDHVGSDYLSRAKLTIIFQSAMWFLRALDYDKRTEFVPTTADIQYTLYPELSYCLGETTTQDLQWLFSGMSIMFRS